MNISQEKFQEAKEAAESFYKNIGNIYCPYLQQSIAFNHKGLEHLRFKARGVLRTPEDQYMRLRLLTLAPEVVNKSGTLQEILQFNRIEPQKTNSRWENRMVYVTYYGLIAIIKDIRIKVVVKQIEEEPAFFWSLVPFWKKRSNDNAYAHKNKKILHAGNLEED